MVPPGGWLYYHVSVWGRRGAPAAAAIAAYRWCSRPIMTRNWVMSGRSPGIGVPGQRQAAGADDDQAQPDQAQAGAHLLGVAPSQDTRSPRSPAAEPTGLPTRLRPAVNDDH